MNPIVKSKALIQEISNDITQWTANMAEAEAILRDASSASPEDKDILTCLGAVLCDQGKCQEAAGLLERAVQLGSRDANTYYNLAVALLGYASHKKAMTVFRLSQNFTASAVTWQAYFDPQAH